MQKLRHSCRTLYADVRQSSWWNPEAALSWWHKAAVQGNAEAQVQIGGAYEFGDGVAVDYVEAMKWYDKAANQGNADGQYLLGEMYKQGNGAKLDNKAAVTWISRAADQGLLRRRSCSWQTVSGRYNRKAE